MGAYRGILLTDDILREMADRARAANDKKRRLTVCDSVALGLEARATAIGSISFRWRLHSQRGNRKSVTKTIGRWPAVTLDEARKEALELARANTVGLAPQPGRTFVEEAGHTHEAFRLVCAALAHRHAEAAELLAAMERGEFFDLVNKAVDLSQKILGELPSDEVPF